jgi:hypothetical protein
MNSWFGRAGIYPRHVPGTNSVLVLPKQIGLFAVQNQSLHRFIRTRSKSPESNDIAKINRYKSTLFCFCNQAQPWSEFVMA